MLFTFPKSLTLLNLATLALTSFLLLVLSLSKKNVSLIFGISFIIEITLGLLMATRLIIIVINIVSWHHSPIHSKLPMLWNHARTKRKFLWISSNRLTKDLWPTWLRQLKPKSKIFDNISYHNSYSQRYDNDTKHIDIMYFLKTILNINNII